VILSSCEDEKPKIDECIFLLLDFQYSGNISAISQESLKFFYQNDQERELYKI
jgi:hypothetical protein